MQRVLVRNAPALEQWCRDLGVEVVTSEPEITVWRPPGPRPSGLSIACLDVREDDFGLLHPEALALLDVRADAYAGDRRGLESALEWLRSPHPELAGTLVFLGGLGAASAAIPVGARASLAPRCLVGRGDDCDLVLRQGGHSDQNLVARRHALISPAEPHWRVEDLRSTNGTFVDGVRVRGASSLEPGQEVAIAGCFRLRVD